jgi:D-alanyl-lipoteichoic acid acyltransferase DltB (MBOAT superfamily)
MALDAGDVPNNDFRSNSIPGSNGQGVTKVVPLLDENGVPLLFDMYIDGIWHGSRRTLVQCESYFNFILYQEIDCSRRS